LFNIKAGDYLSIPRKAYGYWALFFIVLILGLLSLINSIASDSKYDALFGTILIMAAILILNSWFVVLRITQPEYSEFKTILADKGVSNESVEHNLEYLITAKSVRIGAMVSMLAVGVGIIVAYITNMPEMKQEWLSGLYWGILVSGALACSFGLLMTIFRWYSDGPRFFIRKDGAHYDLSWITDDEFEVLYTDYTRINEMESFVLMYVCVTYLFLIAELVLIGSVFA